MAKSYDEIIAEFPKLLKRERKFLREIQSIQRGRRVKDGGWVPAKDLGGTHKNAEPRKAMEELEKKGFLEISKGRLFNGRRYRVPMPKEVSLPTEDELNSRKISHRGKPIPF